MKHYVLDADGQPQVELDLLRWAAWFETADRHIGKTEVGEARVSTVFLGIDHAFSGGPPILYETMIFGGEYDEYQWRYTTRAEAEAEHTRIVAALEAGETP